MKTIKRIVSKGIEKFSLLHFNLIRLKKPIKSNHDSDTLLYSYIDHDYVMMQIVSTYSFIKATRRDYRLVFMITDTIKNSDLKLLLKMFPGCEFITNAETFYSNIEKFKKEVPLLSRLTDLHFKDWKQSKFIQLDADMIWYGKVKLKEKYVYYPDIAEQTYFGEYYAFYLKHFSAGFLKYDYKIIDLDDINNFLSWYDIKKLGKKVWYVDQTCFNYCYSMWVKKPKRLSLNKFTVYQRKPIPKNVNCIHFVRQNRWVNFAYLKYFYRWLWQK